MHNRSTFLGIYFEGKLNEKVSADLVIALIGEHFPIPTITTEQEARRFICRFCVSFGDVSNLTPTVLLDREGEDKTGPIYRKPRSSNMCYLGVRARVQMKNLSGDFDGSIADFNLTYYLHLP